MKKTFSTIICSLFLNIISFGQTKDTSEIKIRGNSDYFIDGVGTDRASFYKASKDSSNHIKVINDSSYHHNRSVPTTYLIIKPDIKPEQDLENKLKKHYIDIPVLQSADSILEFVLKDTAKYEVYYKRRQTDRNIETMDIHFKNADNFDYYYRTEVTKKMPDTMLLLSSQITIRQSFSTLNKAKRYSREVMHGLSNCFQKTVTEKKRNKLVGGKWKTTYLYVNKADIIPFMSITWNKHADVYSNGCHIDIYNTK